MSESDLSYISEDDEFPRRSSNSRDGQHSGQSLHSLHLRSAKPSNTGKRVSDPAGRLIGAGGEQLYKVVSDFPEDFAEYEGFENPFGAGVPEEDEDDYDDDEEEAPGRLEGPGAWGEVDTEDLRANAINLVNKIISTTLSEEQEQMNWQLSLPSTTDTELVDPLGMGKIDAVNMCLDKHSDSHRDGAHGRERQAAMMGARGSGLGRFIHQLAANPRASFVHTNSMARHGVHGSILTGPSAAHSPKLRGNSNQVTVVITKVLPNGEQFDPEAYLAIFHEDTSMGELERGTKTLAKELSERTGQLRQLVKSNFERFISCKDTIDDIYVKLRKIESEKTGVSGEQLYTATVDVNEYARRAFGPVLTRHTKADRIKSVMNLLKRFNNLFGMPRRITALGEVGDYEQVVSEYRKTTTLIKPSAKTARVWVSLYQEIEKRVADVFTDMMTYLEDPMVPPDVAPELVCHILALQAEGLPAAKGCDPMEVFVNSQEQHLLMMSREAQADHERRLSRIRDRYAADPSRPHTKDHGDAALLLWRGEGQEDGSRSHTDSSSGSGSRSSSLLHSTAPTPAQQQWVRHIVQLSMVLLQGLPSFWQVVSNRKLAAITQPPEVAAAVTAAKVHAESTVDRVMAAYCAKVVTALDTLAAAGPLQQSLQVAVSELCTACRELHATSMYKSVVNAVQITLFSAVGRFVKNLCRHLESIPKRLCETEDWRIDLTQQHPDPVTRLPEAIREEVALVMTAYSSVVGECSRVAEVPADASWVVLQRGFLSLLEAYGKAMEGVVERMQGTGEGGELQSKMRALEAQAEGRADMPEDIKLLLLLSNTAVVVLELVPMMVEQYKGLLAADAMGRKNVRTSVAQQSERLRQSAVGMLQLYLERKKAMLNKVLAQYSKPDAWGMGSALEVVDVTEAARELLHCLVVIRSEMHAYSPSNSHTVMPQLVGYLLGELAAILTSLPRDLPLESLLQRYLDLEFLGAVMAGLLEGELAVQLDTAVQVVVHRMWEAVSSTDPAILQESLCLQPLMGCRNGKELRKAAHRHCRKLLVPLLARTNTNFRCFTGGAETAAA